jgi:hypothetical protein
MSYDQTLHMLFVRSNIFMSYLDYLLFDLQWAPQKMRCGQIVNVYLFATSRIASSQKKKRNLASLELLQAKRFPTIEMFMTAHITEAGKPTGEGGNRQGKNSSVDLVCFTFECTSVFLSPEFYT